MKKKYTGIVITFLFFLGAVPQVIEAQGWGDIESGMVSSRYNDVRVPNQGGTLFSLTDDLSTDPAVFFRLRLGYRLGKRHNLILLLAPLAKAAAAGFPAVAGYPEGGRKRVGEVLSALTVKDARLAFQAIRLAAPARPARDRPPPSRP